jgi:hypothetical protein
MQIYGGYKYPVLELLDIGDNFGSSGNRVLRINQRVDAFE